MLRWRPASLLLLAPVLAAALWLLAEQVSPDYSTLWLKEALQDEKMEQQGFSKKLVLFNQLRGAGLNNQLQETLLLALLSSGIRTIAVRPVLWQPRYLRPVPLGAFVDLPTPWVSEQYFRSVCGVETKRVSWDPGLAGQDGRDMRRAMEKILSSEGRCLELVGPRAISWSFLEQRGLLDLFPAFARTILSSPRVEALFSEGVKLAAAGARSRLGMEDLSGILAVHLRRGDFSYHCEDLRAQQSSFTGWNQFSNATFPPPSSSTWIDHCYPSVCSMARQIADLVRSLSPSQPIKTVYFLHDFARKPWLVPQLRRLELLLVGQSTIERVRSTSDLALSRQDRELGVAVDMLIAAQAHWFIGNGFSSLSATITGLRASTSTGTSRTSFW